MASDILFKASTPLDFEVYVTNDYWKMIHTVKHPVMKGRELDVQKTLKSPHEIRRSRKDPTVFLFYRLERSGRWICAVAKKMNDEGFLVTTYPTDVIKEGERVWKK